MGKMTEPNYFVSIFRCCEDCSKSKTCINIGYGCCNYKLYEAESGEKDNMPTIIENDKEQEDESE